MVIVKKFGVLSTAKICGLLSALIFFIFGLAGIIMFALMPAEALPPDMTFTPISLIGAWLIDTLLFAVFGFIGGVLWAGFYNLVVRWVGGIEVELEEAGTRKPKKR